MKPLLLLYALFALFASNLFAARPEPQSQMDAFFTVLGEKGSSAAVDQLCKGTLLETQKGPQLATLPPQIDAAMKVYGKITRIEAVDKKLFGESFVRIRVITYHASGTPLFWQFMFFRAKDEWQLYVFSFNDDFERTFGNNS